MILPDSKKDYYLIVNHKALQDKAAELGYDNVVLVNEDGISDDDIRNIKATDKGVAMVLFPYSSVTGGKILGKLKRAGIRCKGTSYKRLEEDTSETWDFESGIKTVEDAVRHFPDITEMENLLMKKKVISKVFNPNICGNCGAHMGEKDKYCIYCGFKKGGGGYDPIRSPEDLRCVYGPPIATSYKCKFCGHRWIELNSNKVLYCPDCGRSALKKIKQGSIFTFTEEDM